MSQKVIYFIYIRRRDIYARNPSLTVLTFLNLPQEPGSSVHHVFWTLCQLCWPRCGWDTQQLATPGMHHDSRAGHHGGGTSSRYLPQGCIMPAMLGTKVTGSKERKKEEKKKTLLIVLPAMPKGSKPTSHGLFLYIQFIMSKNTLEIWRHILSFPVFALTFNILMNEYFPLLKVNLAQFILRIKEESGMSWAQPVGMQ